MARKDIIKATQRELRKLHLVKKVIEGILHRSWGRESNRAYTKELRQGVIELYRTRYDDFGPISYAEKLAEHENVVLSDETVRKWLIGAGLWQKAKKRPKHRQWPERRKQPSGLAMDRP